MPREGWGVVFADGTFDRASIRTRLTSLWTRCSMKFDLTTLLSLSRPLPAGRGLAVAANSVCPFAVAIPEPSLNSTFLLRAAFLNLLSTQRSCFTPPSLLFFETLLSRHALSRNALSKSLFQNVHSRMLFLETLFLKTLFSKLIAPILDGRFQVRLVRGIEGHVLPPQQVHQHS